MIRPLAIRGRKRFKRRRIEKRRKNEVFEKKGKTLDEAPAADDEREAEEAIAQMPGIPIARGIANEKNPKAIFVLEGASLEIAKIGKAFQILNAVDHYNFLRNQKRDPAKYRPDIVHQALLAILDSPLTKAGRLQALYVRTVKGVLFEVKPHVHLPRMFKRFCGLMAQLLQKLSIVANETQEKLLNVIKNPVTRHLPVNSRRIGLSSTSPKAVEIRDYVAAASDDTTLVFVVGAMADGTISNDYTDDFISISDYKLSAACCLNQICDTLKQKWHIR